MKEITIYVAEDGTKFNTEEECRDYERSLITVNAKLFDKNKKQITINSLSEAYYIILNDVASLETIDNLLYEEGESHISYDNFFDIDELSYALEFAPQLVYYKGSWCWWNAQMAQLEDIVSGLNYEY